MRHLIILSLILMVNLSSVLYNDLPDLSKKEDLDALGRGRIIETDHSIITNISLSGLKEYWIVYIKNESQHDMMMDKIEYLEFRKSFWGPLKIRFQNNKPLIERY